MTSKFEQLIEYVINDEEQKARELFHDIVVEKSREIYENLMNEEDMCDHCHKDPCVCEDENMEESDDSMEEEKMEEGMDSFGGDASDDLIDDVETEEQGMAEDNEEFDDNAEEAGHELTHDMEQDHDEGDIEDRVVDLEDKLDELMSEFEALMGGDDDGMDSDLAGDEGEPLDGDALAQDDTQAFADEQGMMENVQLDKVATPKMGDDGANNKSVVAFNSGARGMQGAPVKMTGDTAQGRSAPKTADLPEAGTFKNVPGKGTSNSKLSAAPKPMTAQATGVNTKTPFPRG
jgi:hypothetical protein